MDWIYEPWPWYLSGPLIALVMFILLFMGKEFGVSSNFRAMCSIGGAGKIAPFFRYDWKKESWNLFFIAGGLLGGFLSSHFLSNNVVKINPKVAEQLSRDFNIHSGGSAYLPPEIYGSFGNGYMLLLLLVAGFLVGFGTRYAGGCTSGHAISGLSNLQIPSLIAVIGFFIGGLTMVYLLFPLLF